jgi:hypothetical protein
MEAFPVCEIEYDKSKGLKKDLMCISKSSLSELGSDSILHRLIKKIKIFSKSDQTQKEAPLI